MTTSKQIRAEIAQIEAGMQPTMDRLDRLYEEFGLALPNHVEKWMREHLRRRIEDHAESVNAGGIEPLRQIKTDLAALIGRLPEICSAAIGERSTWPHHQPGKNEKSWERSSSESHAALSFRRAIGHLGALLAKHGLLKQRKDYVPDWERVSPSEYRYAISPGFEERNYPVLKEYQDLRRSLDSEIGLLTVKRHELAKAQACELWDEA